MIAVTCIDLYILFFPRILAVDAIPNDVVKQVFMISVLFPLVLSSFSLAYCSCYMILTSLIFCLLVLC